MLEQNDPAHGDPDPDDFDPDESDIDSRLELRSALSETLATHGYPDTLVLARERADVLFHDRRLAVLDHLREHDPDSVRALADDLGHDKGVVSRDLQALAAIDVVEYESDGTAKAPRLSHRHVVVEPVV